MPEINNAFLSVLIPLLHLLVIGGVVVFILMIICFFLLCGRVKRIDKNLQYFYEDFRKKKAIENFNINNPKTTINEFETKA